MSTAQTDLQAMIDFRQRLMRFNATLDTEYRAMVGSWRTLGDVWRDEKYREFGGALDEVGRGIDRYLAATSSHEQHLQRLIASIDEYLRIR